MSEERKKRLLLRPLLQIVERVEIMGTRAKQASCVHKIPVARITRVCMLIEYKDLFHVSCLSILIL